MLPKAIYTFKVIPMKIPMVFFKETEQKNPKLLWNYKAPNSQSNSEILREKNKVEGIIHPGFIYYQVTIIKTP